MSLSRLLFALVLGIGLSLASRATGAAEAAAPGARNGQLDLTAWDFEREGPAQLDGEWDFYWQQLLAPGQLPPGAPALRAMVPGDWNQLVGTGLGAATYRLRIACTGDAPLALQIPMQHTAFALFVNGQLAVAHGQPGLDRASTQPSSRTSLVPLGAARCPLELVAQVANHELRRGGLVRSIGLGTPEDLTARRDGALARTQIALGGVLSIGLLSLSFFLWRRRDPTPLYFALFALCFGAGLSLAGDRALGGLGEAMGFALHYKLLFGTWYGGIGLFALFMRTLYRERVSTPVVRGILAFSALGVLMAVAAPVYVLGQSVRVLQAGAAFVALYMGWVLLREARAGERGALGLLVALLLMAGAIFHDVVFFRHHQTGAWLPWGTLGFILVPAALLAQRFAQALARQELRTAEHGDRAELLLRATQAGLLEWDAGSGQTRYNQRFREMLGYDGPAGNPEQDGDAGERESIVPPFRELVDPRDEPKVHTAFMAQLRDRSVRAGLQRGEPLDYRMRRADGATLWVHAEAVSLRGEDGRVLRYICSFMDITAIKETELALASERERLRLLMRSTRAGFGDWDAVRDVVTYSDRFKEMLGHPADADTSGWPSIFERMHPDDREAARAQFRAMIRRRPRGGEQQPGAPMSYRLQRKDGSYIWIHAEGVSLVDDSGRTVRFITSYLDVTALRQQEQALREQMELTQTEQRRLGLVVRAARVGIVDWDGLTHETYYSPRFREIRGYPPDADTSAWPDYFKVMIHPDDRERITRRWVAFIRGKSEEGKGTDYAAEEYRLLKADGSYVWVEVSGVAVRGEQGFVSRWIAAIIDITERRAQAAQLEAQNEALKENVRLREEVERIGRHDLKTPLNSIVAVPRLLREERKLGPEADELLGIVERAGYRILSMVNLSLDLYKMEQGSYVLRPDAVDLADLVRKVEADVRMHAAAKQVRVAVSADSAPYAWAEELLCYSLLANLLKNAVEASPEGGTVRLAVQAGPDQTVLVVIHNAGAVPEGLRANFFQKYATLGKASGTGLGTYSARLMARVQDGDVRMHTSDAAGTTLTVQLRSAPEGRVPAMVRHAAERRHLPAGVLADLRPLHVLLVDDDEYNLMIVRRFLPSPPFTVQTAINGKVALAAAELQWPDVVFMDLDMPIMGGLEAVAALRALQRAAALAHCTFVALSSHEDDATQARALAAGFDRYLSKPVTREQIHETLLELEGMIEPAAPPPAPADTAAGAEHAAVRVDPDLQALIPDFLASRRALAEQLAASLNAGDRAGVQRLAHQLAGSLSLYGFSWGAQAARWLETHCGETDTSALAAQVASLRRHLEQVQVVYAVPRPDDLVIDPR